MNEEIAALIFGNTRQVAWSGLGPLLFLLLLAAWSDARSHRIPNRLVFGGALLGVVLHLVLPAGEGLVAALPGRLGGPAAVGGLLIGLAAFLPLYLLRAMGAGDVKLMAMVGAFLGPRDVLGALLCVALAGGLLSIAVALRRGVLRAMLRNIRLLAQGGAMAATAGTLPDFAGLQPSARLPYGVAIAAGTAGYLLYRISQLGWF